MLVSEEQLIRIETGEWIFDDTLSIKEFNKHFKANLPLTYNSVVDALLDCLPSQKEMYRKWIRGWGFQFKFRRSTSHGRLSVMVRHDFDRLTGDVQGSYHSARKKFEESGIDIRTNYNEIIDRFPDLETEKVATYDDHETNYDVNLDDERMEEAVEVEGEYCYQVNEEGKKGPITAQAMKKKRGKEDVLKDYKEPSYSENPMTFGDKSGPTKPGG